MRLRPTCDHRSKACGPVCFGAAATCGARGGERGSGGRRAGLEGGGADDCFLGPFGQNQVTKTHPFDCGSKPGTPRRTRLPARSGRTTSARSARSGTSRSRWWCRARAPAPPSPPPASTPTSCASPGPSDRHRHPPDLSEGSASAAWPGPGRVHLTDRPHGVESALRRCPGPGPMVRDRRAVAP